MSKAALRCLLTCLPLLWAAPAWAQITGISLSPGVASVSGGTVTRVTVTGTAPGGLQATVDGVPVTLLSGTSPSQPVFAAPPHGAGAVTVAVSEIGNPGNSRTAALTYVALPVVGLATPVERVSLSSGGTQGVVRSGGFGSFGAVSSGDGRYVFFESQTDLGYGLPSITGQRLLYRKDRQTGELLVLKSNGVPFSGDVSITAASLDGSRLLFKDFVGGGNAFSSVHPFTSYEGVSVNLAGNFAGGLGGDPALSGNGQFAAFANNGNLDSSPDDALTPNTADLFVRNLATNQTERWTTGKNVRLSNQASSADGRYVVFATTAQLVPADTNSGIDVYLLDRAAAPGDNVRLLTDPALNVSLPTFVAPVISAHGRSVAFVSSANNLVPGDTNNATDVFVIDLPEGGVTRASVRSDGVGASAVSLQSISGNGRRIAFTSTAINLTSPSLPSGFTGLYVHDRNSGQTVMVHASADGTTGDAASPTGRLTPDGRAVLVNSLASHLVADDTNAMSDVFLKGLPPDVPVGSAVRADPFDPVTGGSPAALVFASVTTAGTVSIATSTGGPGLPSGFSAATPYYDITTTAAYAGTIDVCLSYAGGSVVSESALRLLHDEGGTWVDVTTSADAVRKVVCGRTTTLSPFVVANPPAGYLVNPAPGITAISPSTGTSAGGTAVTITGTGFLPGAAVTFGGVAGTVTSLTTTSISVTTPVRIPGPATVVVSNPDGQSATAATLFTYTAAPAPTVTSFSPSLGPLAGGNNVTINGTNFQPGAAVVFGGAPATVVSVAATQIVVTMPPGVAPGTVTALVRNPDGQVVASFATYIYVAAPVMTAIAPVEGPSTGGTVVTITGQNFQSSGTTVRFGATNGTSFQFVDTQTLRITSPALGGTPAADTAVDVSVAGTGGTAVLPGAFTYRLFPRITTVSPPGTPAAGGGEIVIRGANFLADSAVVVDGVPATSVIVDEPTTIRAVVAEHPVGVVDVEVYTSGGTRTAGLANAVAFGPAPAVGASGPLERANVKADGSQASVGLSAGAFSRDGRFVAFITAENGFVSDDANGRADAFVRDLESGATEQVNLHAVGGASSGAGPSGRIAISDDGRYVVFATDEPLVADDTNGARDVYLRDRQSPGLTEQVSLTNLGAQIPGGIGTAGTAGPMTPDGRFVTFTASGTGVTAADTNSATDVFVRDRQIGATTMVSISSAGVPANANNFTPWISAAGRFVVFASAASNLGTTRTGTGQDVLVHDRDVDEDGTFDEGGSVSTTLVSRTPAGEGGNASSSPGGISADGRFVLFHSAASNLLAGDLNGVQDAFLFDRQDSSVARISAGAGGGAEGNGASTVTGGSSALSADGRHAVFTSAASNLVPFDGNGVTDVFRYDRSDRSLTLVSADVNGVRSDWGGEIPPATLPVSGAAISGDGANVFFASTATNLVAGDTNGVGDLFVKTLRSNTAPDVPGGSVAVAPVDPATGGSPVTLDFSSVASGGETSLVASSSGDPLPEGFSVGTLYYDIATTATLAGPIEICISYAGAEVGDEGALRMMHFEDGDNDGDEEWVDITRRVDAEAKLVCGETNSLSPFVIAVPTATAVTVSATASTYGGTTDLSALVSPAGASGSVTFYVNGSTTPVAAGYVPTTGVATASGHPHGLPASATAYPVRVVFESAATNYAGVEKTDSVLSVTKAAATVSFVTSTLSQVYDGSVKTVATATDPGGLTVDVAFTGTPQDAGTYDVSATIADANHEGSTQGMLVIAPAATQTQVASGLSPSTVGQQVTFTATVRWGGTPVTVGGVTFRDGAAVLAGPIALDASGQATFSTTGLAAGSHTVTAEYGPTTNFQASSGSVTQTVNGSAGALEFSGFFAPIDMPSAGAPVWNSAKVGQAIPVKWQLTRSGAPVEDPTTFDRVYSNLVSCDGASATVDPIEEYAPGNSSLQYLGDGNWQFNWSTPKAYANTCRTMSVRFSDGTSSPVAYFRFK